MVLTRVSPALIIYEFVITVGDEIELFWKQKRTLAFALFLINRYLVLIYNLTVLRGIYPFALAVSAVIPASYQILKPAIEVRGEHHGTVTKLN